MSIYVSEPAAEWYKKELGLKSGDHVRFFARYSSGGGLHPGFSLGIAVEPPQHAALRTESGGVVFFMEEQDEWYLKGYKIEVKYLPEHDDIIYEYSPE
ncbi:HesB/YadR/YfhF family protein [Paenibacillus medicaginis]|uniref:HesB/YadR/YfhF family protein n=1 Tax=Paenibacillus medicaginis TaxID=1470560 RepID=A0ABV5BWG1_9BACL